MRAGLSIGIAIFPVDGADATTLIGNADAALYRAKAEGRGTFRFFEADMDQRLRERRVLQQELRSAIERNELALHYQPQARIGGEIIGFEALVRWHHPQRGMIPPGTFIPLAEESGLIMAMGEWILREACREAASWPNPLQIAINLSPVQFRHGDLPALVHSVLLETGLPPSRLGARDHRRRADRRLLARGCRSCDGSRRWACASPWTISEPAILRCPICSRSRSTRSRSTNPSSPISGTTTSPRPSFAR